MYYLHLGSFRMRCGLTAEMVELADHLATADRYLFAENVIPKCLGCADIALLEELVRNRLAVLVPWSLTA